ncbi:MAG: DUF3159 domain-containing protein [Frankiaceae bacterium]
MSVSRPDPRGPARLAAARVRELGGLGDSADAREHVTPLAAALGGWRGMFDSGFPAVVFVSANAIDGLRTGVIAALGAGVLILLLRLARRQPIAQAVYGFVAVVVCAFVAARLGKAEGYFLPGILINAFYAGVGVLSVLVKRPLAGYVLAALDRRFENWRVSPSLRRCSGEITLIWSGVFLLRFAVQTMLYASERVGWLAVTKIVLGWPVTGAAILVTLALIRRVRQVEGHATASAVVDSPGTSAAGTGVVEAGRSGVF